MTFHGKTCTNAFSFNRLKLTANEHLANGFSKESVSVRFPREVHKILFFFARSTKHFCRPLKKALSNKVLSDKLTGNCVKTIFVLYLLGLFAFCTCIMFWN